MDRVETSDFLDQFDVFGLEVDCHFEFLLFYQLEQLLLVQLVGLQSVSCFFLPFSDDVVSVQFLQPILCTYRRDL